MIRLWERSQKNNLWIKKNKNKSMHRWCQQSHTTWNLTFLLTELFSLTLSTTLWCLHHCCGILVVPLGDCVRENTDFISWLGFLKLCLVSFAFQLLSLVWLLLYVRSGVRVKSCVRDPPLNPGAKHRRCFLIVGRCSVSAVQVIWNWCMWASNVCFCASWPGPFRSGEGRVHPFKWQGVYGEMAMRGRN